MYTPVFIDELPDASTVSSRKSELYRLTRARGLTELLLDGTTPWHDRACPGCGQDRSQSGNFSQALIPFHRCSHCNTIYAAKVPAQAPLDALRARLQAERSEASAQAEADAGSRQEFEFVSVLNWIRLTEARAATGRPLAQVLDYRFCSENPAWPGAVARLAQNRGWQFLPLDPDSEPLADLARTLRQSPPDAVLLNAELDRSADPRALLQTIRDHAPEGTLVFVATSCADGLEYEILGADSPSFVPLDRLNVFSVKGFEALARGLGYDCLEISTPGRLDAVILQRYFTEIESAAVPFWSGFFREADRDRLRDLQILLQRSLRSGVMRFVLKT